MPQYAWGKCRKKDKEREKNPQPEKQKPISHRELVAPKTQRESCWLTSPIRSVVPGMGAVCIVVSGPGSACAGKGNWPARAVLPPTAEAREAQDRSRVSRQITATPTWRSSWFLLSQGNTN